MRHVKSVTLAALMNMLETFGVETRGHAAHSELELHRVKERERVMGMARIFFEDAGFQESIHRNWRVSFPRLQVRAEPNLMEWVCEGLGVLVGGNQYFSQ